MPALARFALVLMVVLFAFSVAGSSATTSAVRTAIPDPSAVGASTLTPSPSTPPRQSRPTREATDKKMLAWILLLIKEGPGAR